CVIETDEFRFVAPAEGELELRARRRRPIDGKHASRDQRRGVPFERAQHVVDRKLRGYLLPYVPESFQRYGQLFELAVRGDHGLGSLSNVPLQALVERRVEQRDADLRGDDLD